MGWDRSGGLNRYLRDLHEALEAAGADPRAVVFGPAAQPSRGVLVAGDESDAMPLRLGRYARAVRRASDYDVVDAHFALYAWYPVLLGVLRRRPLVVHFHGPWAAESVANRAHAGRRAGAKRRLERSLYRRASRLIVLSSAFRDVLVEQYDVEPARVRVVPPGVDSAWFTPGPPAAGVEPRVPTVFTARRLVPRTGVDVLIRAWSRMAPGSGQLLIAGEGPDRAELDALIELLGLGGSVRMLGRISEDALRDEYRAAAVSVMPSLTLEGFGLAVLESLACGTPVIVTDAGGLPEAVRGLDPSLVVPAGDAEALADRLSAALAGEVPSSEACRAHAEGFSWEAVAADHLAIYREAQDEAAGRPPVGGRPLRVVYLDHCARLSGAEIALVRLIEALPEVDARVILGEEGPIQAQLEAVGASVEVLPLDESTRDLGRDAVRPSRLPLASAVHTSRYVLRLARLLRRMRPDVVHTNSLKSALYGSVAGRLAGVPVVWHARDRIADDYLPGPAVAAVRAAARWLPQAVIANSHATMATLALPARRTDRAVVVADPHRPDGRVQRRDAGAGLTIGIVGRLTPWKGQHVFLQALAQARLAAGDRAVLIGSAMFGEEGYEAELRTMIHDLGLDGRAHLAGFRSDVAAELAQLDILVHASVVPEPFGQVVVEGMAAGVPVIATGAGGPAEIITDGVDGLLHPPGDVDALAEALDRLTGDPDLRARLAAAGRLRAQDFGPEVVGPQVMEVYEGLVHRT